MNRPISYLTITATYPTGEVYSTFRGQDVGRALLGGRYTQAELRKHDRRFIANHSDKATITFSRSRPNGQPC